MVSVEKIWFYKKVWSPFELNSLKYKHDLACLWTIQNTCEGVCSEPLFLKSKQSSLSLQKKNESISIAYQYKIISNTLCTQIPISGVLRLFNLRHKTPFHSYKILLIYTNRFEESRIKGLLFQSVLDIKNITHLFRTTSYIVCITLRWPFSETPYSQNHCFKR